jgi:hypothetical protein
MRLYDEQAALPSLEVPSTDDASRAQRDIFCHTHDPADVLVNAP